jgi:hypothetical protein
MTTGQQTWAESRAIIAQGSKAAVAGAKRIRYSGDRIFELYARDHTGHFAYYFVLVPPQRLPQFKKAIVSSASLDIEAYGEIVFSGYGDTPEEVRSEILSRYG